MKIKHTIEVDGVVVWTGEGSAGEIPVPVDPAPTPVPVDPAPTPVPVDPAPTPVPGVPVPGRTVLQRPLTRTSGLPGGYPMGIALDMTRFNPYVFSCPANAIHAHAIRFESSVYTKDGATFSLNQFVVNTNRRDAWISDAPGSATRVDAAHYGNALGNGENANLYVTFTTAEIGKILLQRDRDYWLNVMPTNLNEAMDYFIVFNPSAA